LYEKVLLRGRKPVPLTPKVFDTLRILLENNGRLLEKDKLMKEIWKETVVEESNLASNIKTLRKALGDDANYPKFIETVPRRGYRFIAEVEGPFHDDTSNKRAGPAYSGPITKTPANSSVFRRYFIPTIALLALGTTTAALWYALSKDAASAAPILSAPFVSEKLSTDGKVQIAAISSDGKIAAYVSGLPGEKQSVWLRQLETGNNIQIIPPSDDNYFGIALSHDDNVLYFSRRPKGLDAQGDIYRDSIFGGIPTKIISDTQGTISVSPDDEKIVFRRCYWDRVDDYCSLWIADAADGKNERKLLSRSRPVRIGDSRISPDGLSVAFAAGQSDNAANDFGLSVVDIGSGAERELTTEKFFNIRNLAWLPDQSGLLLTASRIPNRTFRIWYVSADSGDVEPLTGDSESYSVLSLDKEARRLVSTKVTQDFHLRVFNTQDTRSQPPVIADGTGLSLAPNGTIVFSSMMTGDDDNIWSINPDGSGKQQLTNDPADDRYPVVSSDGNRVFFSSNRTGEGQVWRMNADGSDQIQITKKEGGFPLFVSPDGRWIYYHHGLHRTLWRASTAGGVEEVVLNMEKYRFAISPDASMAAFSEKQGDHDVLMIVSLDDGQTVKTFGFANPTGKLVELKWSSDGKNLAYSGEWKPEQQGPVAPTARRRESTANRGPRKRRNRQFRLRPHARR
jgi:DNA-binding winged helix-turn-helix (wHTH) protein/Tol biopolymer transport system component